MCITCVTIYIHTCVHIHFTIYIHLHCISTNIDSIGAKLDAFQAPLAERSQSVTMNITHGKRCVIPPKVFILPIVFIPRKVFFTTKSIYILQHLIPSKPPSLLYDNSPHHPMLKILTPLAQKVAAHIVSVDSQIHIIC